jgi:hypothetical protein
MGAMFRKGDDMRGIAKVLLLAALVVGLTGLAFGNPIYTLANSNGGDGYLVGAPPSFQLFGADNSVLSDYTTYIATFAAPTEVEFSWSYTTYDCCGSYWDPAGYVFDGMYYQLSTDVFGAGYYGEMFGVVTQYLNAGDTFGWYVASFDGGGPGEISVNIIPEPSSMILFGTGLVGFLWRIRRKLA